MRRCNVRRVAARACVAPLLAMLSLAALGDTPPRKFYVNDIKEAMAAHIEAGVDDGGIFHLRDDQTGEMLALKFVKIHDPVRQIDGTTYFACTDFEVVGETDKLYDLDFWLRPAGDRLEVYDTKVHKEPRHSLIYGWFKYPRYTFIDDQVVYLY
jgi:hypothetical protein